MSLLAGSYYGYNTGIVTGLKETIVLCEYFPSEQPSTLSSSEQSMYIGIFTSCILFGGIIGTIIGVPLADKFGRKRAYFMCGVLGLLPALLGIVSDFWSLVVLRTLSGVSIGFLCAVVPLYVTEVVEPSNRGSTGTLFQVSICFFIFIAQLTNYLVSSWYDPDVISKMCVHRTAWKLQLSLGFIPGLLMMIHACSDFPESEDWLSRKAHTPRNRVNENERPRFLSAVGQEEHEEPDDLPMPLLVRVQRYNTRSKVKTFSWKSLFCSKYGISWAGIGLGLASSAQLTGINAVIFHAPEIFKDAGFHNVLVLTMSVVGVWNFLSVFASLNLVDKIGRRPLMMSALIGMSCSMLLLAGSYTVLSHGSRSIKVCSTVSGLMGFIFFFEIGPGALFYLMASETFPRLVRARGLVFTNVVAWTLSLLVTFSFPVLNTKFGTGETFFMFATVCALCSAFIFFKLPETKGDLPPTPTLAHVLSTTQEMCEGEGDQYCVTPLVQSVTFATNT